MDSRFFVFKPIQKDSFFSIRKVGIREPDKSLEVYSRILRLIVWYPTGLVIGHLDFRLPQKYISHQKFFYEHINECQIPDQKKEDGRSKWSAYLHARYNCRWTFRTKYKTHSTACTVVCWAGTSKWNKHKSEVSQFISWFASLESVWLSEANS